MKLRIAAAVLLFTPTWIFAQDAHTAQQAKAAAEAEAAAAAAQPREAGATPDLKALIADPAALEKGRKLFMSQCIDCHGPKGEGSRGPNLAQPNLPRASDDASLLRILRSGIAGTEMPGARLKPGEAPYLAAYVRSLGMIPVEQVNGDPAKGAELFRTKGACLTCHAVNGEGMTIGPELTDIGRRRGAAFLRRALVEPGAEVPQNFIAYRTDISLPVNFLFIRAKTKEGKEVAGVRVNEDAFTIQVRDLTGFVHSFEKSELAELKKDKGVSPMPVYAGVFTPTEMDDVIAYLASLKGKK